MEATKTPETDLKQIFVYNLYWEAVHGILLFPARAANQAIGAYHDYGQMPNSIHCGILSCSILDRNQLLDANLGVRVLRQLTVLLDQFSPPNAP